MQKNALQALKADKERYILQKYPTVIGVGISEKESKGFRTGNLALTVYVSKKLPEDQLDANQIINKDPHVFAGLQCPAEDLDIKEIGHIRKHDADYTIRAVTERDERRPVESGVSEGHYAITAGTGGPLVYRPITRQVFRLSNNHVYADENKAKVGDAILQPGPYDGGTSQVGTLAQFILLDNDTYNTVDCALRTLDSLEKTTIFSLGKSPTRIVEPQIGMQVVKVGRTTSRTVGIIEDVDLTIQVEYDMGLVSFKNQILISSSEAFSRGGDSGSGIYTDNGGELEWVGLLFAGSDEGNYTIANYASQVASALGVELFTETPTPEPEPTPKPEPPPNVDETSTGSLKLVLALLVGLVLLSIMMSMCAVK